ncbi:phytase [Sphingomonas montana]|uniref:phytase n=1 Tax=Sphingomonas montana TaxID=1843236 RepID=UPI00096FA630|nr:phytase [Sphingomonas montana]
MRTVAIFALLLAGCAPVPQPDAVVAPVTAVVQARAETDPVDSLDDAADDPAIWRNPADPAASLIVATDKRAGIHLYDLNGKRLGFTPSARLNNVDLRDRVTIGGVPAILVAASDRADVAAAKMALFRLDAVTRRLLPLASVPVGPGEAYGMCLWRRARDGALFGFVVMKDGRIDQMAFDLSGAAPTARRVRSLKLGTQSEGCVADDRTGRLYVSEEDVGLWSFDAEPDAPVTPRPLGRVDGVTLFADAEGMALAPRGRTGGYLIVSSQGDNAYALYRLPDMRFAGRFRIGDGRVDATSETDGIDLVTGDFGPDYPGGLLVVQDGDNAPATQNFKLTAWADVLAALRLR